MNRNESKALIVDLYELTMAQCYFDAKRSTQATFDLFVRRMPKNRSFLVMAGLQDIIEYIREFRFSSVDIAYLRGLGLFSGDFLRYLSSLRFTGDIRAMEEGTVFFANEPVIRVTAPLIEAQLIEGFLLNTINLQTMIASKAVRSVLAAGDRSCFDFSLRRTHGQDASIKAARSSYIAGFSGTSNMAAGKKYGIPVAGTMAHSFVMSFASELEAFLVYTRTFPDKSVLLVDTYDDKKGVDNAVLAGSRLKQQGHRLQGIRLDSGDIAKLSRMARARLDSSGLGKVKIVASGNLDEFAIARLTAKKAAVDSFGIGTHMGTSSDAPVLDVIYKLGEVTDRSGRFYPTMKLSRGKVTLPGRKQVWRRTDAKGMFSGDIIGLEKERVRGEPLLRKVVASGKVVGARPSLEQIRARLRGQLARLPQRCKNILSSGRYPVNVSPGLSGLTRKLTSGLKQRQGQGPAVFVDVDTQFDFMHPAGRLYVDKAARLRPRLKKLTCLADRLNIPIVSSLDWHSRNDPEFKQFPGHCVAGSPGSRKIIETRAKRTRQLLLKKSTFDLFSNPAAGKLLSGYSEAYVYGVALDYCVKAACAGLVRSGVRTFLVLDATAAVTPEGGRTALAFLRRLGVNCISTAEVARRMSA